MKYLGMYLLVLCAPFFLYGQTIETYSVDLRVQDNADIHVQEQVLYNFTNNAVNTITHTLPLRYAGPEGKRQSMEVSKAQATINGKPIPVQINSDERMADLVVSYSGDQLPENSFLELDYVVSGAIRYYTKHNQVLWNPMTSQYQSSIEQVTGSVHIPRSFKMLSPLCTMVRDKIEYNCNISPRTEGGFISYYAQLDFWPNDQIEFDARFHTGVEVTVRSVAWTWWEWGLFLAGVIAALVLMITAVLYGIYRFLLPEDTKNYYSQKYKGKAGFD